MCRPGGKAAAAAATTAEATVWPASFHRCAMMPSPALQHMAHGDMQHIAHEYGGHCQHCRAQCCTTCRCLLIEAALMSQAVSSKHLATLQHTPQGYTALIQHLLAQVQAAEAARARASLARVPRAARAGALCRPTCLACVKARGTSAGSHHKHLHGTSSFWKHHNQHAYMLLACGGMTWLCSKCAVIM